MIKLEAMIKYLKEVRAELKKVSWPAKKEVIRMTTIVVGVSVGVGAIIAILDLGFTKFIELLLK